jgi:hypothetical protein
LNWFERLKIRGETPIIVSSFSDLIVAALSGANYASLYYFRKNIVRRAFSVFGRQQVARPCRDGRFHQRQGDPPGGAAALYDPARGGHGNADQATRFFAILLILFVAVTTFYFHDFWNQSPPENAKSVVDALKNLSIIGALFVIAGSSRRSRTSEPVYGDV